MEENKFIGFENNIIPQEKKTTQELQEINQQKAKNNNPKFYFSYTEKEIKNKYCEICKKKFSTASNLRNHLMTIHQNLRPFKCPFPNCKKKYSIQSRLQVHYRIHSGKKPFICTFCSKAFNEKGNLKTHERFHSDNRPFKCNLCSKTYKTNGHLKDHIQIQHMKIKRFQCNICEKKFGRISTLKSHLKIHSGEKNYKCQINGCNKYFAEKGNMEIHYKRHLKRLNNEKINKNNFENDNLTRVSSNFTLNNLNKNNMKILSSFNNKIFNQNNNCNNYKNILSPNNNDYNKNNNNNNFINQSRNISFPFGNVNYPNNIVNNNDNNELNYLDSLQDINFESEKVFEVNLDN